MKSLILSIVFLFSSAALAGDHDFLNGYWTGVGQIVETNDQVFECQETSFEITQSATRIDYLANFTDCGFGINYGVDIVGDKLYRNGRPIGAITTSNNRIDMVFDHSAGRNSITFIRSGNHLIVDISIEDDTFPIATAQAVLDLN